MGLKRRNDPARLSETERAELAETFVGLTLEEAKAAAHRAWLRLEDRTEGGWYAGIEDRRRVIICIHDGRVVSAELS